MFFVLYVRFIMPLSVYRITLWLVLNVDKFAYDSGWFRQVYFHSTIKLSRWRGRKLTGYQTNELGNSPSIYISRYRSLKSFALIHNSSAFATNSSHVNVQGVFVIVFYIQGTKFKSRLDFYYFYKLNGVYCFFFVMQNQDKHFLSCTKCWTMIRKILNPGVMDIILFISFQMLQR